MKLTENFNIEEFKCNCCNALPPLTKEFLSFVNMLQRVRNLIGKQLIITSGYRCEKHNRNVGGASGSYHLLGLAVDIKCVSSDDRLLLVDNLLKVGFRRIGISSSFIHVDTRKDKQGIWLYT